MEAHGRFHGIFSSELHLVDVMEASTSTTVKPFMYFHGSFHGSLSTTMSIRRSLSAFKGALLSTFCRNDMRLKVRESAWIRGWCWLACAPD